MVTTGEYGEITVLFFPWILPFSNLKVREKEKSHNSVKLTSNRRPNALQAQLTTASSKHKALPLAGRHSRCPTCKAP